MSSFLGEIGGITGGVASEGLAFAAGFAAAKALGPAATTIEQDAWNAAQVKRLDALIAAHIAAEGISDKDAMAGEASYSGIDSSRFEALYQVSLTAPGMGELLTMLRRGTINPGNFTHGLRKQSLEPMWDAPLAELQNVRLSPQELALGIVRSVVRDPGLLAVTLDLSGGVVPAYPTWPGDVLKEAEAGGIDVERLRVLVGEIGLPMSAQQAASAYFRDIIKLGDFNRAILEGDTRPEWAPYILEQARLIPTPHEFEEGRLRGWITKEEATVGAARHGMTAKDAELVFDILGRPIPVHAVVTGLARGGTYGGDYEGVPEPFLTALRQSSVRPEWGNLAYANRYSYPSAFVIRALATGGEWTEETTKAALLALGWKPSIVDETLKAWYGAKAATADKHVTKAENSAWTTLHKSYVNVLSTDAEAQADLRTLGVAEGAIASVLSLWQLEREIERRSLTPAQLKKAVTDKLLTSAAATQRLRDLGYSAEDAGILLAE